MDCLRFAGSHQVYRSYSPDFSPIEPAFAKLRQLLRSAAHRTADALWSSMRAMLDRITAADAAGFSRHGGYPLQVM